MLRGRFAYRALVELLLPSVNSALGVAMSALLNFRSFLIVLLLFICTSTFLRSTRPSMFREKKPGIMGLLYKASVIGTRLSPWVSLGCILMSGTVLFF